MNILVFPAGMPEARAFMRAARRRGDLLVGASSVGDDGHDGYSAWEWLPFVTQDEFAPSLMQVVRRHAIEGIYTPHPVIWHALEALLPDLLPDILLVNPHPLDEALAAFRHAAGLDSAVSWRLDGLDRLDRIPPAWLRRSLLQALAAIPGQSSATKLAFLSSLAMNAPAGDIVEIGSLWGRSAFALALAARHAGNGPVLCVEPWHKEAYAQAGSSPLLAQAAARLDAEEAYACFLANLAPFAGTHCNYLRMPSCEAAPVYAGCTVVNSQAYGATPIAGRIALLHIDGNHDLPEVQRDLSLWTPFLLPGAWLVLDDYRWPFGDGPRQAGDAWLEKNLNAVDVAFTAFDSLWIRMRG